MPVKLENVGIAVRDLDAAVAFFTDLGLTVLGRARISGEWADTAVGLDGNTADSAGATEMAKRLVESTTYRILGVSGVSEVLIPPLARRKSVSICTYGGQSAGRKPPEPRNPRGNDSQSRRTATDGVDPTVTSP